MAKVKDDICGKPYDGDDKKSLNFNTMCFCRECSKKYDAFIKEYGNESPVVKAYTNGGPTEHVK